MMSELISEGDYCTQEVAHMLLDLPLSNSSRTVNLN
jgi:hypothetical protein